MSTKAIMNCPVSAQDLYRADAIIGKASSSKGKKKKMASVIANVTLTPRVIQVEQNMKVDLFFVKLSSSRGDSK